MTPTLTAEQRLAQAWQRVEVAFRNLEIAEQHSLAPHVLERLIVKHNAAADTYRKLRQEIGAHV